MIEIRNHIVLIFIASVPLPKSSKKYIFGMGFRENIIFGFILRVVAGSKVSKEVGCPKKEEVLAMDPRGLFLNASLRVKVSQSQPDLFNSFSGPEFKVADSTLQRELFLWPRENLYPKSQMFPGQPPWRSMSYEGELVNIMERQVQTHPFYRGGLTSNSRSPSVSLSLSKLWW